MICVDEIEEGNKQAREGGGGVRGLGVAYASMYVCCVYITYVVD